MKACATLLLLVGAALVGAAPQYATRRQAHLHPGQFRSPVLRPGPQPFQVGVEEGVEGSGGDSGGGIMSMLSAPRHYINSLVDGMRNYFTGEEEEPERPRQYRDAPFPGHRQSPLLNLRRPLHPQNPLHHQQLIANSNRFGHLNSVYQPAFNQFRVSPLGAPGQFPSPLLPQNPFLSRPGPPLGGFPTGFWTGGFSSHYKQYTDKPDNKPIHHVQTSDTETEDSPPVAAPQPPSPPAPVPALTSSYSQLSRHDFAPSHFGSISRNSYGESTQ